MNFVNANVGTIVGDDGIILRTTDGGSNWVQQISDTTDLLYAVHFSDENHGATVGFLNGTIHRTTDGGQSWVPQITDATGLLGVYFVDANIGTVVGNDGAILRTTDGGQNWTPQTSGTSNQLRAVWFTDANTGTVVGGDSGSAQFLGRRMEGKLG